MIKRMILPLVFGLAGAAILMSLGSWQVRRLAEKQSVLAQIDATIWGAAQPLPVNPTEAAHQFLPVEVTGTILEEELHVLGSVKKIGAGYRIISVIETDQRRILLDRGFVAIPAKGAPRPPVRVSVSGNLHWPDEINASTPPPDAKAAIWFARDIPAMAKALNTEPVMLVLRESDEKDVVVTPFPVSSSGIPNDHLEYAVTWFGLAAVWLGMTGYLLWRIRRKTV